MERTILNQAPAETPQQGEENLAHGSAVVAAPAYARVSVLLRRYSDASLAERHRRSLVFYASVLFAGLILAGFTYAKYAIGALDLTVLLFSGGGGVAILATLGYELLRRNLPRSAVYLGGIVAVLLVGLMYAGDLHGFELYLLAPLLCWQFVLLGAFGGMLIAVAIFAVVYIGLLWPAIPGADYTVVEVVGSCVLLALLVVINFFSEYARQRAQEEAASKHADRLQGSLTDPVTGVFKPAFLNDYVYPLAKLAEKSALPMGCIVCQIDDYAGIVQRSGEAVAEDALRSVAAVIAAKTENDDVICRGDDGTFTVLCQRGTMEVARRRAEDIRQGVEALVLSGVDGGITISSGVAVAARPGEFSAGVTRASSSLSLAQQNGGANVVYCQS